MCIFFFGLSYSTRLYVFLIMNHVFLWFFHDLWGFYGVGSPIWGDVFCLWSHKKFLRGLGLISLIGFLSKSQVVFSNFTMTTSGYWSKLSGDHGFCSCFLFTTKDFLWVPPFDPMAPYS